MAMDKTGATAGVEAADTDGIGTAGVEAQEASAAEAAEASAPDTVPEIPAKAVLVVRRATPAATVVGALGWAAASSWRAER